MGGKLSITDSLDLKSALRDLLKPTRFMYKYKFHIALALGVLLLLTGCKSAQLKVLESSALKIQPSTGSEVSRSIQDKSVVLGKPVYAEVSIEYKPNTNHTTREVYEEIIKNLEKNNWTKDEVNVIPDYYSATSAQEYSTLKVRMMIDSQKNLVRILFVNLGL